LARGLVNSIFAAGKSEAQHAAAANAEITRLLKANKRLALEVEDAEDKVEAMAAELRAAGDAVANATRRGVGRELELGEELEHMKKAKASDKLAMQV
jgi:hypothetical protein